MSNHQLFITRQAPIILFLKIVFLSLFFDLLLLCVAFLSDAFKTFDQEPVFGIVSYDTLVFLFLIFLQAILSFTFFIRWFSEYHMIDQGKFVYKKGLIFPEEKMHMLDLMATISSHQDIWGKTFHYGDINIKFSGELDTITLNNIANPREFIHLIEHHRKEFQQHSAMEEEAPKV